MFLSLLMYYNCSLFIKSDYIISIAVSNRLTTNKSKKLINDGQNWFKKLRGQFKHFQQQTRRTIMEYSCPFFIKSLGTI